MNGHDFERTGGGTLGMCLKDGIVEIEKDEDTHPRIHVIAPSI